MIFTMEILAIALLTLVSSAIGTIMGFGTSTIMVPVLVLFFPPVTAIFLVTIIHWFSDLWKVILFKKGFNLRLVALLGITGVVTGYGGAALSLAVDPTILLRALGVFLSLYALFLLLRPSFTIPARPSVAVAGGAVSGFFAGVFGVGGAVRSVVLTAFNLPKEVYVATAGAIGILVDSTRIITYLASGVSLPERLTWGLLIFIPVSFVGAYTAKGLVNRISQERFRVIVALFLFVVGIKLIVWP